MMKKINIKKYIKIISVLLLGGLIYSCSNDDDVNTDNGKTEGGQPVSLSIALNSIEQGVKSSGNHGAGTDKYADEKAIYRVDAFVFKSLESGETDGTQLLDGYGSVDNTAGNLEEIKNIRTTAGERDVYVVVNASQSNQTAFNIFDIGTTTLNDFRKAIEKLEDQFKLGAPSDPNDSPIGGIDPSKDNTTLTMYGSMLGLNFSLTHAEQYLGYLGNGGRPTVGAPGYPLTNGIDKFNVQRLAARVAIEKIDFQLPASLRFEGASIAASSNYTWEIQSVFLMNVKKESHIIPELTTSPITGKFVYGSTEGYNQLKGNSSMKVNTTDHVYMKELNESLFARTYDITNNQVPLWFYAFENTESNQYPTYFVIAVKYDFENSSNQKKSVVTYYPVIVNADGVTTGKADHNYIKRNHQYKIKVTIKGLSNVYDASQIKSASSQDSQSYIYVEEEVGTGLFPWTGNVYND